MASFGEELKRERELRDISLKEIAQATNISVRFLEALEKNDFAILPGGLYVRGFIRSVARHLGLDVDETLAAYQQEAERQEMLNQPAQGSGGQASGSLAGRSAETVVISGFVLAAALMGCIYWASASVHPDYPAPDPAAHSEALRARMMKAGALPPATPEADGVQENAPVVPAARPATQSPPVSEVPPAGEVAPGNEAPSAPERLVGIRALETTRVQLTCAGVIRFKDELWVGVERQFPCREPILLSATNAGAIEYSVDAQPLEVLGEAGRTVKDVPIHPAAPNARVGSSSEAQKPGEAP